MDKEQKEKTEMSKTQMPLIAQPSDLIRKTNNFIVCPDCGCWIYITGMSINGLKSKEQIESEKEMWLEQHMLEQHRTVTLK